MTTNQLEFVVVREPGLRPTVGVVIDSHPLGDSVAAFERSASMPIPGGYGPLNFEQQVDYFEWFTGTHNLDWPAPGRTWLLGCPGCGTDACSPIECAVDLSDDFIVWRDFVDPHRPEGDYSGFGPFVFDRLQFESAIVTMETALSRARKATE